MTTVYLSPLFNGSQLLTDQGVILAGGKIYTYFAGTTTAAPTYTTTGGTVQNSNPIQLNSSGRPPQEIWIPSGQLTKFVVTDSSGNPTSPSSYDNITGINDPTYVGGSAAQWLTGVTPTYISATSFSFVGSSSTIGVGRRLQLTCTAGAVYGRVQTATFGGGLTTVVMIMDGAEVLDSGLSALSYSFLSNDIQSIPVRGCTTSGGDAYIGSVGITTYNVGDEYNIRFNQTNSGATPTIALDGLAAISITDAAGSALVSGQIASGAELKLRYCSDGKVHIVGQISVYTQSALYNQQQWGAL